MEKIRSNKELGEVMLNNNHLFKSGLCNWINKLILNDLITHEEFEKLDYLICNNRPTKKLLNYIYNPDKIKDSDSCFYWKENEILPRIKWINKYLLKK